MSRAALAVGLMGLLAACGGPVAFDRPVAVVHDERADVYLVADLGPAGGGHACVRRVQPDGGGGAPWIADGERGAHLLAPRALCFAGDDLWVADGDRLRRFDRGSGAPRGEVGLPAGTRLVAVAAAPDGALFAADAGRDDADAPTGTDAIWLLPPGGAPTALARGPDLGGPLALVATAAAVYASTRGGAFFQVDRQGRRTELRPADGTPLPGLVRVDGGRAEDGRPLAARWFAATGTGALLEFDALGRATPLTGGAEAAPAGMAFDATRGRLLLALPSARRLYVRGRARRVLRYRRCQRGQALWSRLR